MFSLIGQNARISLTLSRENIQSRFIGELMEMPYNADTPNHTVQGFVVNKMCDPPVSIFFREDHEILFKDNNLWLFIDNSPDLEIIESIVSSLWNKKNKNVN